MTWLKEKADWLIAGLLFLAVWAIYTASPNTPMSDSVWALHLASSLLNAGDLNLDEFEPYVAETNYYAALPKNSDGHILSYFPVGGSILAAPLLWVSEHFYPPPGGEDLYRYMQHTSPYDAYLISLQHVVAALLSALIAPVFYFIGLDQAGRRVALVAVVLFALGSSAYSIASRVLWQHGPSMLMIAVSLLLFVKAQAKPRLVQLAGMPLAFSFVIRPTNSVSIAVLTIFVLVYFRRQLPGYLIGAAAIALPFFWLNQLTYHQWLPNYYSAGQIALSPSFWEALAGNLVSPARGLFVFSPVLLFAVLGVLVKLRGGAWQPFDTALVLIIFLHWLVISSFGHWWGGHSYGPRFFSDILPYVFYFLLPSLAWLLAPPLSAPPRPAALVVFGALALASVTIHTAGATRPAVNTWNDVPAALDWHAHVRLWDWSDPVFLRTAADWPVLAGSYDIAIDRESYQPGLRVPLWVHNQADEPAAWALTVPETVRVSGAEALAQSLTASGLPVVAGKQPLLPGEGLWLELVVEADAASTAEASLGAAVLQAKDAAGNVVSEQVIPISWLENGGNWRESAAIGPRIWLPQDVTVNGAKPTAELYALFGAGWYLPETWDSYRWRWARSPAELAIFSGEAGPVTLTFSAGELYDTAAANGLGESGTLTVRTGAQEVREEVTRGQQLNRTLWLERGWNLVEFELASGNFRPSEIQNNPADSRLLSFTITALDLARDE